MPTASLELALTSFLLLLCQFTELFLCLWMQVSPLLANFDCCLHCHTNSVYSIGDFFPHFIFFSLVRLLVNLLCISKRFFSTFCQNGNFWSAKILFSSFAWDSRGSHFAALATCSPWQHCRNSLLWDANCGLNVLNPRFANLSSNRTSNYAILTAC